MQNNNKSEKNLMLDAVSKHGLTILLFLIVFSILDDIGNKEEQTLERDNQEKKTKQEQENESCVKKTDNDGSTIKMTRPIANPTKTKERKPIRQPIPTIKLKKSNNSKKIFDMGYYSQKMIKENNDKGLKKRYKRIYTKKNVSVLTKIK